MSSLIQMGILTILMLNYYDMFFFSINVDVAYQRFSHMQNMYFLKNVYFIFFTLVSAYRLRFRLIFEQTSN